MDNKKSMYGVVYDRDALGDVTKDNLTSSGRQVTAFPTTQYPNVVRRLKAGDPEESSGGGFHPDARKGAEGFHTL